MDTVTILNNQIGPANKAPKVSGDIQNTTIAACQKAITHHSDYLALVDPKVLGDVRKAVKQSIQKGNFECVADIFYKLLTQRPEYTKQHSENPDILAKTQKDTEKHQKFYAEARIVIERTIQEKYPNLQVGENPAWFSIQSSGKQVDNEGKRNFKTYTTISVKDYSFITKIIPLANMLSKLAEDTGDTISMKVPRGFLGFITHNDSIVVHFKKPENQLNISQIIEEWCQKNQITQEPRALGRTIFAFDPPGEGSFSQAITQRIAKWIEQHHKSYPTDILIDEALQYIIRSGQQAPKFTTTSKL